MEEKSRWDWHTDLKEIPVKEWDDRFNWVQTPEVSPDGEAIAAVVNLDEMAFSICVNGEAWEAAYEKAWSLTPLPSGGFAACVARDEEWTVTRDGSEWSNWFDFIWNLSVSPDGNSVGAAFQSDMEYGIVVNDAPWEERFESMTGAVMAPNGASAAVVQVAPMPAADVGAFKAGLFSAALNGEALGATFLNVWDISFDQAGDALGYGVRFTREAYGVVRNETPWESRFQSVWKPEFARDGSLMAPVRQGGKWFLYKDDAPFWHTAYDQLWHLTLSPANDDVAAIVSAPFGRWTVAVNDSPWNDSWDTMISDLCWSRDGSALAAVFKHGEHWDLAVNQTAWGLAADKVFDPCISPDGSVVAVRIEKEGDQKLVVNNRVAASGFTFMADPVISPDNSRILVKGIENGIYKRRIISL